MEKLPEKLENLDRNLNRLADAGMRDGDSFPGIEKALLKDAARTCGKARVVPVGDMPETSLNDRKGIQRKAVAFALFAAAACLAMFFIAGGPGAVIGEMEYRSSLASVSRKGGSVSESGLKIGDVLETNNGMLAATLDDRVHLMMNKDCRTVIDEKIRITLHRGEIWLYVRPGSGDYFVQCPEGTVHVIGTSFGVTVQKNGSIVTVGEGKVLFNRDGENVAIKGGGRLQIPRDKPLSGATLNESPDFEQPPEWARDLLKEISVERFRKFFPSGAPIE